MATSAQPTTTADEYEYKYPAWVYQVPGFALIVAGFGGVAFISLF